MTVKALKIGAGSTETIDLSVDWLNRPRAACDRVKVGKAVAEALESPLGLPALRQYVTSDDLVVIAIAEGTPAAPQLAAGLIEVLLSQCGVEASKITVVVSDRNSFQRIEAELPDETAQGVTVERHDPDDADVLCFVGMTRTERPLLVNRRLFEADVILPVSGMASHRELDDGPYAGIYPDFFDRKTIERVRRVGTVASSLGAKGRLAARRRQTDEAGWLLGAPLVIRVIAAANGQLAGVVAGEPEKVAERAAAIDRGTWVKSTPDSADLVIVQLGGAPEDQTWSDVGRALAAAEALLAPGGLIALWSELNQPIGPSLGRLSEAEDRDIASIDLSQDSGSEGWAAWQMIQALERGPVFFHGQLPVEVIEDLGLAPISDPEELLRLASRYDSCLLVEDAQHIRFDYDSAVNSDAGGLRE